MTQHTVWQLLHSEIWNSLKSVTVNLVTWFLWLIQIDPELSRTVIVSTKLDTKILQFARASDVEVFLKPPACTLDGCLLGGSPFFTSVPSGRVGSGSEAIYRSNEEFKKVLFSICHLILYMQSLYFCTSKFVYRRM